MVKDLADERVDELTAAALLSWTKGKQPRETGILTRIGRQGFVTVNDFSTVLAGSDHGGRDQLFSLLRVAYDGSVTRDLGNAPRALRWEGRLTILAACTPAIDHYSSHADALGPSLVVLAAAQSQRRRESRCRTASLPDERACHPSGQGCRACPPDRDRRCSVGEDGHA